MTVLRWWVEFIFKFDETCANRY